MAFAVKLSATSREPEDYARAMDAARATRAMVAEEMRSRIAAEVAEAAAELVVAGDVMGGRSMLAVKLRALISAESTGDQRLVRAAVMDIVVAGGAMVAAIDYVAPPESS